MDSSAPTESESIGRRLRPRSPVKTIEGTSATTFSSKEQTSANQIEAESDPPSTSASEDNFLTRMTKRNRSRQKKKEDSTPASPKVDSVFAVKPGGTFPILFEFAP